MTTPADPLGPHGPLVPETGKPKKQVSGKTAAICVGIFAALLALDGLITSDPVPAPVAHASVPPDLSASDAALLAPTQSTTATASAASPSASSAAGTTPTAGAGQGANAATSVHAWYTATGKATLVALIADNKAVYDATQSRDVPAMTEACDTMRTDVIHAETGPPIPDAQAQDHWAKALGFYEEASLDCYTGGKTSSAVLILDAGDELAQGAAEIKATTDRIMELPNS